MARIIKKYSLGAGMDTAKEAIKRHLFNSGYKHKDYEYESIW